LTHIGLEFRRCPFENPQLPSDPLEAAIAAELWRWAFNTEEQRREQTSLGSKLASLLEYYLCGAFQAIDFARTRGLWCDGVAAIEIAKPERCVFHVAAAAYVPHQLAPVELEFHFPQRRALKPTHTIVRFGRLGADGEIVWAPNSLHAPRIVANRPGCDADWAIVVQLSNEKT
jgi:hypothetical protein